MCRGRTASPRAACRSQPHSCGRAEGAKAPIRDRAPASSCRFRESQLAVNAAGDQLRLVLRVSLPSTNDPGTIDRIELYEACSTPGLVGRNQRRATAAEEIEHDRPA